ncbi:MAG: protein-L-isoaspartate(D-aspartate) O-methyltransferase [Bacteroidetes bacterium]|nr:protein-L-isoaspartate(D-aspartate) O-methyltransferase [Bacteroidota bacterium]
MEDTFRHKGLRKKLVETVKKKGIRDKKILEAINKVPRHLFMDTGFINFAYKDQAFPIGEGQTISQPYTVACQTQLLDIQRHEKVLEIGTGSGYQAAILMELGARVYTIERHRNLFLKVQTLLPGLGYRPNFFYGDGFKGLPSFAPFDKILITAAATYVPEELLKQLKVGGRMVVPVGGMGYQEMTLIIRKGENDYERSNHGGFVFVPMVSGTSNGK